MDIPIVSRVIEPLKAIAFAASPGNNKHQAAFLDIVRDRGRIDPSALVLKTQGLRALLSPVRALRLWMKGKISPSKTFLGWTIPGAEQIRRLFSAVKGA